MATVTGSVSSAFLPYLSDILPTTGVTTSAPSPVTCVHDSMSSLLMEWNWGNC